MGAYEKDIITVHRIKEVVAAVKAERPAYEEILGFYEKLLLAQESSKGQVQLEPIQISEELLSVKQKDQFPLIDKAEFSVDTKASEDLLRKICWFSVEMNEMLADAGTKVVGALDKGTLDAATLFSKILNEDDAYLDKVARSLEINKKILAFFAYSSIRPSLSLCAEQLATYIDKDIRIYCGKGGIVLFAAAHLPCQSSGMKGNDPSFAAFADMSGGHGEYTARFAIIRITKRRTIFSANKKSAIGWMCVINARSMLRPLILGT